MRKFVIISKADKTKAKENLARLGCKEGIDFIEADVLFPLLDEGWQMYRKGRKLLFWGVGTECTYLEEHTDVVCDAYIDKKKTGSRKGKPIFHPDAIVDWREYYVVVTSLKYYLEIKKDLEGYGVKEYEDFVIYRNVLDEDYPPGWRRMKPSAMLRETIYATSVPVPLCRRPFDYLQFAGGGHGYCCCPAWVDLPFGSLSMDSCERIWESNVAKVFRLSMLNHTFSFCRTKECAHLKNYLKGTGRGTYELPAGRESVPYRDYPETLLISIDPRCNLKCPQCRDDFYRLSEVEENMMALHLGRVRESGWLEKSKLSMAGFGEVFFSPVYRKLLFDATGRRKSIGLISNGLLCTEEIIQRLIAIYDSIGISISVDAGTSETYRKIRGGNFDVLLENIRNMVRHRKAGEINAVGLTFVTQKANYAEIPQFIALAHALEVDRVSFQKIHAPGYMDEEEFGSMAIATEEDVPDDELRRILATVDRNDSLVNWFQLADYFDR